MALIEPTASSTVVARGDTATTGISFSSTMAPQVTTTELRRIEAGLGPSMASSSQRCMGNWAHLPMGPAISPRPSSVPARGLISCSALAWAAQA